MCWLLMRRNRRSISVRGCCNAQYAQVRCRWPWLRHLEMIRIASDSSTTTAPTVSGTPSTSTSRATTSTVCSLSSIITRGGTSAALSKSYMKNCWKFTNTIKRSILNSKKWSSVAERKPSLTCTRKSRSVQSSTQWTTLIVTREFEWIRGRERWASCVHLMIYIKEKWRLNRWRRRAKVNTTPNHLWIWYRLRIRVWHRRSERCLILMQTKHQKVVMEHQRLVNPSKVKWTNLTPAQPLTLETGKLAEPATKNTALVPASWPQEPAPAPQLTKVLGVRCIIRHRRVWFPK